MMITGMSEGLINKVPKSKWDMMECKLAIEE